METTECIEVYVSAYCGTTHFRGRIERSKPFHAKKEDLPCRWCVFVWYLPIEETRFLGEYIESTDPRRCTWTLVVNVWGCNSRNLLSFIDFLLRRSIRYKNDSLATKRTTPTAAYCANRSRRLRRASINNMPSCTGHRRTMPWTMPTMPPRAGRTCKSNAKKLPRLASCPSSNMRSRISRRRRNCDRKHWRPTWGRVRSWSIKPRSG